MKKTLIKNFLAAMLCLVSSAYTQVDNLAGSTQPEASESKVDSKVDSKTNLDVNATTNTPKSDTLSAAQVEDANANITGKENTVLSEIEVVSDEELRSFFIFVDDFSDSDMAIKEMIDERDLASDEFLMQNIDREEFEQERVLLVFKDLEDQNKRKSYGVLKVTDEDFKPQVLESTPNSANTVSP